MPITIDDVLDQFIPVAPPAPTPGSAMDTTPPPPPLTRPQDLGAVLTPPGRPIGIPQGGPIGQTAGTAYSPLTEALARWGVHQGGPVGDFVRWAAPGVNALERGARSIVNMAGETTGIPSAARAGEALASGDYTYGLGQALMALPSRVASIPGMLLSEAGAEPPDPRVKRIQDLQAEIAQRELRLRGYGNRQFPSAKARADAVGVETAGIQAARDAMKALQDTMDAEANEKAAAERRLQASAEWRNTSTQRAYPGVGYGTTALGLGLAGYLPFRGARGPTLAYNQAAQELNARWQTAVQRATDMTLTLPQRKQAAQEAIGLRDQVRALTPPEGPTVGERLTTAITSGLTADAGIMAPDLFDYIYSMQDPSGQLHSSSASQLNPANNPGRVTAGFLGGAGLGGVGEELGLRFPRLEAPTGYEAETDALLRRYPSLAPRGRRRR